MATLPDEVVAHYIQNRIARQVRCTPDVGVLRTSKARMSYSDKKANVGSASA